MVVKYSNNVNNRENKLYIQIKFSHFISRTMWKVFRLWFSVGKTKILMEGLESAIQWQKKLYLMLHGINVKSTIIINESLYNLSMLILVDKFV